MRRSLIGMHHRAAETAGDAPALFESELIGYAAWDEEGRVTAANAMLCRLAGVERKSLEHGRVAIAELLPGLDRQRTAVQERTIVRGGVTATLRIEVNGEARQALVVDVTPQHAAEQALATARDLLEAHAAAMTGTDAAQLVPSERLQDAQTQLERQQIEIEELLARVSSAHHELESFSYSVSHDLRTPLRALDGFSRELLERYAPTLDPTAQHYVNRIRAGAQKLDRIIDDLLRLSRVGRTTMNIRPVDLAALARTVAADLSEASTRKVRWVFPEAAPANADRELITIVLQNLLQNAWKFTAQREEAVIELRADTSKPSVVYSVRDDGIGFDMRYADKLFAPFQRLHATSAFEGTGIGLATVKRIIHRHGGQVWAESAPGAGATFSFTLGTPLKEQA
ncbi:MAG TPA: ATP-binding protein [Thermoanaerobaculia bacterium]